MFIGLVDLGGLVLPGNKNWMIASVVLGLATFSVFAGQQTGVVSQVTVRAGDGLIYFNLNGSVSGRPTCATKDYWIVKDENSVAGKQQLATLLAARASGQQITVNGLNTCSRWVDGEDANEIKF